MPRYDRLTKFQELLSVLFWGLVTLNPGVGIKIFLYMNQEPLFAMSMILDCYFVSLLNLLASSFFLSIRILQPEEVC